MAGILQDFLKQFSEDDNSAENKVFDSNKVPLEDSVLESHENENYIEVSKEQLPDSISTPTTKKIKLNFKKTETKTPDLEEEPANKITIEEKPKVVEESKQKESQEELIKYQKEKEEENNIIKQEELFEMSGTSLSFKDKWERTYNSALKKEISNLFNDKVKNGKFRYDKDGVLEILPEMQTYGKSSKELLESRWEI